MTINSFYGFKINQFQTFDEKEKRIVVTCLKAQSLLVKQIKNKDKDHYWAYQVAILRDQKSKKKQYLKEIRIKEEPQLKIGDQIKLSTVFKVGDVVKVTGLTKGKGFAGVVKRWGFAGGPHTHGQSDRERAPGSIGMRTTPGRVWKGKKMPGHMGNKTKTIKGLRIFKIDEEKNELWLKGVIPGGRNNLIKISQYTK